MPEVTIRGKLSSDVSEDVCSELEKSVKVKIPCEIHSKRGKKGEMGVFKFVGKSEDVLTGIRLFFGAGVVGFVDKGSSQTAGMPEGEVPKIINKGKAEHQVSLLVENKLPECYGHFPIYGIGLRTEVAHMASYAKNSARCCRANMPCSPDIRECCIHSTPLPKYLSAGSQD
jgi:hypothetical protein